MSLDHKLKALFDLIRDEAKRNAEFRDRLENLLETEGSHRQSTATIQLSGGAPSSSVHQEALGRAKRGNRRAPALFDPVVESELGEAQLREKLGRLDLEQLRNVVADFRMDPSRLVMKWKDREKVIDHVVQTAMARRQKGDAFRP